MATAMGLAGRADGVRMGAQPAQRALINGSIRFACSQRRHPVVATPAQAAPGNSHQLDVAAPRDPLNAKEDAEIRYLSMRAEHITAHFPDALGVDDFMQRLEIALWSSGFSNDNSIACINLCRDEVTHAFKHKIDQIYGSSFNINGLGAALTCGVTGMGAGLSHSPICETSGKERYVFFSFPHIAIDAQGAVGNISRPGRTSLSCACGALIKSLGEIKSDGLSNSCRSPGVHDPLDTEYSILKQRLARRLEFEGHTNSTLGSLDLVELTKVAERTITSDLEFLISKAVDVNKADYAVVTGVQIHNWGVQFDDVEPNLEFVYPTSIYTVVDGVKRELDLTNMPSLTPRQIRLLATAPDAHHATPAQAAAMVCNSAGDSTVREIDPPYMYNSRAARRATKMRLRSFARKLEGGEVQLPPELLSSSSGSDEELEQLMNLAEYAVDDVYWSAFDLDEEMYKGWASFGKAR